MISIVTGTLNRLHLLKEVIQNTVLSNDKLELILVDGGSTDGTIEYIKSNNFKNVKFIEIGGRSFYHHYMNIGIENSNYEYICQWNDDVLLINDWNDVINSLDDSDVYLFNWKYGNRYSINDSNWLRGNQNHEGWFLTNDADNGGECVMNFGIYKKNVFRKIGMYSKDYEYYYTDGDMSYRAYQYGFKIKDLRDIKVLSFTEGKVAIPDRNINGEKIYKDNMEKYRNKNFKGNFDYLG